MNSVNLIGRIGNDLELKVTTNNIYFCKVNLAVRRQYGDNETDWINVIVWKKNAENIVRYCKKGSLIAVFGSIQTRSYESEQGMRYITEVVCDSVQFLESKKQEEPQTQSEHHEFKVDDSLPF